MTRLRLDARDDYMHAVDDASNFNESMYFNCYDRRARVGGFFRIGNRPNEGYAEVTTCVFLPDGRVAFAFARPEIAGNDSFDAGGMRFDVVRPMERLTVAWQGKLCLLGDPAAMAEPKRAFAENPWAEATASLDYEALAPAFGGEADEASAMSDAFARGHYVQHLAVRGSILIGPDEWTVDGLGIRDHSWGPRWWQTPWWYRWLNGMLDPDNGFVISVIGAPDGSRRIGGVMLTGGELDPIEGATIESSYEGPDVVHRALRAHVRTAAGAEHSVEGRVLSLIPLRNRRDGAVTRITEGMTEWRAGGMTGYGLSEYLDQIVDGRPVGADDA